MIPERTLGKTGISVSIFGLGGEAAIQQKNKAEEAETIINRAIDLGVNYIDTAPAYFSSEDNIGRVMAYRRKDVFLATKTRDRTYNGTMQQIEGSLKRLKTNYIDLYQLHDMQLDKDLKTVLGKNGAIKALEELKEQKVIRFTGITGHKYPDLLLRAISDYPFDCLLMSFNAADTHYRPFKKSLLPEAVNLNMGIIAMKVASTGRLFRADGISSMKQAMDYVLSYPISTAIVGINNVDEVEENVSIAKQFKALDHLELKNLERLTANYAEEANFFKHFW